ncbi:MAG: restriction endonuclease [Dehalococcoidia bacterium]|jgi:HJR/Mrr/RecB family endonuclease|nr:restriction endonuclease [Chloroflexota bacterium]MCK4242534.1 restriction endonuclease [Dehalococcoidia bacterium]
MATDPKKWVEYEPGTPCFVGGCDRSAEYEVYIYDYYPHIPEEFFEQDYTCPFLCEIHMTENEANAEGRRVPRGFVLYPYTNRHHAQGYSKYAPISQVYPLLLDASEQIAVPQLILAYQEVNEELIRYLASHPRLLYNLDPRQFEKLVMEIFRDKGFDTELTPRTRDGGKDIHAVCSTSLGCSLYVIECKRYESSRKVGVEAVRALYGVVEKERVTKGIIVTTSSFTNDAIDFATPLKYRLSLRDYDVLTQWLAGYGDSRRLPPFVDA